MRVIKETISKMNNIQLSGCAIIEEGKILLLWKINRSHYEFPGGKIEPGETPEQTAIRETIEEIGCDVKNVRYFGRIDFKMGGEEKASHIFLADLRKGQSPRVNEPDTFREIRWIPLKQQEKYAIAPNVKEFIKQYSRQ